MGFAFGTFVLVPERRRLVESGTPVRIGRRAFDILLALVERQGELVSKRELMAQAWPESSVDESNLKVNISALRQLLGHGPGSSRYIATVAGRGYRFVGSVQTLADEGDWRDARPKTQPIGDLPGRDKKIFGREEVIASLRGDLEQHALVSVVGPGGVGKTTVALAVAREAAGSMQGAWLVDFTNVDNPRQAVRTFARGIGVNADADDLTEAIVESLRDRELLIVLDNCETVLEPVAEVVDCIVYRARGVRLLATSREPLCVRGERVRRLPGLAVPPIVEGMTAEGARPFGGAVIRRQGGERASSFRAHRLQCEACQRNLRRTRRSGAGHRARRGADRFDGPFRRS